MNLHFVLLTREDCSIVLVHGLTGSSHETWLDKTGVHSPTTILSQDIDDARILAFGYDADVVRFGIPHL
jgi:protein SERAC1